MRVNDIKRAASVDEFIATYPKDIQTILRKIKAIVREKAPAAEETIAYGIPTFRLSGKNLVHFSAFKAHIGLYPTPSVISKFDKELSSYKRAKGSVQFPLDQTMPYALIERMVEYRVKEMKDRGS